MQWYWRQSIIKSFAFSNPSWHPSWTTWNLAAKNFANKKFNFFLIPVAGPPVYFWHQCNRSWPRSHALPGDEASWESCEVLWSPLLFAGLLCPTWNLVIIWSVIRRSVVVVVVVSRVAGSLGASCYTPPRSINKASHWRKTEEWLKADQKISTPLPLPKILPDTY